MVKLICICLFSVLCFAQNLDLSIKELVGEKEYQKNSEKFKSIFSDKFKFIDQKGNPDYLAITNSLVTNSLLNLNYAKPLQVDLTFKSTSSALLLLKVVTDSLNKIGYTYFLSKEFYTYNSQIIWKITINTQFVPSPSSLYKELKTNDTFILGIKKNAAFSYVYDLDMSHTVLKTDQFRSDIDYDLSKPLEPYFLNIHGKKSIEIRSKPNNSWVAYTRIFDKDLNLLSQTKSKNKVKSLNIDFPPGAYYILIDDAFSLENIKYGLKIYVKSN